MTFSTPNFKKNVQKALKDTDLQSALIKSKYKFVGKRAEAVAQVPEFEALRNAAEDIKNLTLENLDVYLEQFEAAVIASGGQVHWAEDEKQAQDIIIKLCQQHDAKLIAKSKSMVSEEINLNDALETAGLDVIETDLGEYIIQLANETPSHIIAPAVHKTLAQVSELFHQHHQQYGLTEKQEKIPALVNEARTVLRKKFLQADVGITGANFLIANTGTGVLVTNEGNADLSCTLPKVHIMLAGIEKVVPSLDAAAVMLRLLARSATGQEISTYTSFITGPKREQDLDGPEAFHVVLLDNGRSRMLGGEFQSMLRCIRCGACLNHCPVYSAIGGHAYGWTYPGPMGSVLTPMFKGLKQSYDLPNACTLNGRCQEVCPVKIPLPDLLRELRVQQHKQQLEPRLTRMAMALWGWIAIKPKLYRQMLNAGLWLWTKLRKLPGINHLLPAAWTKTRNTPELKAQSFVSLWNQQKINNEQRQQRKTKKKNT